MSNDVALKMKQKQYEATVIDFVQNQKGRFIVVTDDQAFLSVLRTVLNKHLMLDSGGHSDLGARAQPVAQGT